MKDLILYIVQNIVNNPDDVTVDESTEEKFGKMYKVFTIHANKADIGMIVGKGGNTIQSIRNIVKIRAIKEKEFVDVRVSD